MSDLEIRAALAFGDSKDEGLFATRMLLDEALRQLGIKQRLLVEAWAEADRLGWEVVEERQRACRAVARLDRAYEEIARMKRET